MFAPAPKKPKENAIALCGRIRNRRENANLAAHEYEAPGNSPRTKKASLERKKKGTERPSDIKTRL
jgi:hypothetical protein